MRNMPSVRVGFPVELGGRGRGAGELNLAFDDRRSDPRSNDDASRRFDCGGRELEGDGSLRCLALLPAPEQVRREEANREQCRDREQRLPSHGATISSRPSGLSCDDSPPVDRSCQI